MEEEELEEAFKELVIKITTEPNVYVEVAEKYILYESKDIPIEVKRKIEDYKDISKT